MSRWSAGHPWTATAAAHPQVRIAQTGDARINKAIGDTVLRDLHRAELWSFPAILAVGGLVAFVRRPVGEVLL